MHIGMLECVWIPFGHPDDRGGRQACEPGKWGDDSLAIEPLLTVEEVAGWLAIAERKVSELARDTELPGFKVGKEWRFAREEVLAYLETRRNKPRSGGGPALS
jgi:excisionase family DNA binding protein